MFSRNFSSSRAIPTRKLIQQVCTDPAVPIHWGINQPGMQATHEMSGNDLKNAKHTWMRAVESASKMAQTMADLGAHKQIVNRIIEPFLWANGIVTSTEWDNFFDLRAHPDAQPEIHELALRMREAMDNSTPKLLNTGEWHLPYLTDEEKYKYGVDLGQQISAARCCRVSYLKHDGTTPNVDEDLALFERLAGAVPLHASPLEHQATPDVIIPGNRISMASWKDSTAHGNFSGWIQFRKLWEREMFASR